MKLITAFLIIFSAFNYHGQTSCFSSEDDVMLYVIDKTFESEDGQISIKFNPSEASLRAGENNISYMYEQFSYLGSGYKGLITLTDLSDGGGLKLYVSCKEKMMTDNKGTFLYEEGTISNSSSSNGSVKKGTIGNSSSSNSTVKIGNLEVMTKDLGEMNWYDAMKACADLGDGWRLPTIEELTILHQNKDKIGGFANKYYWSSKEGGSTNAYGFPFGDGFSYDYGKGYKSYVRAVRAF